MNLSKRYFTEDNQENNVLKNVCLDIKQGEITCILGNSGSGKSTLLYIMGGLLSPDNGSVLLDGVDIYKLNDLQKSQLINTNFGFIFQDFQLIPSMTVAENIALPSQLKAIYSKDVDTSVSRIQALIEKFSLFNKLQSYPSKLSGGEQQRVAIIRALVNQPKLIFCDEPTGNLDSKNSEVLVALIKEFKERFNYTFILVTHNEKIANIANRKYMIEDGRIFAI